MLSTRGFLEDRDAGAGTGALYGGFDDAVGYGGGVGVTDVGMADCGRF